VTCFNFESLNKVSPLCCFGIVEATPSVQHSAELRKLQDWRVLGAETLMDQRIKEMLWWCGMCFLPLLSAGLRDDTCWCGYWLLCTAVEAEKVPSASLCLQRLCPNRHVDVLLSVGRHSWQGGHMVHTQCFLSLRVLSSQCLPSLSTCVRWSTLYTCARCRHSRFNSFAIYTYIHSYMTMMRNAKDIKVLAYI